jgi:ammonium transporter, Amt family
MRKKLITLGLPALLTASAFAQDAAAKPVIDGANSAWMLVSTALVLLMTPALALFYGGMVQKKNVLNTMLMSFVMMGVVSLIWVLVGFSLAFGKSTNGLIGSFEYLWGSNISLTTPYGSQTIPAALFMLFQMKFAIITPALISGAIAERVRFRAYVTFMIAWSLLIYTPLACWVWNPDGWLLKRGALDFAGGTVVHLASGVSALALCFFLGKRSETKIAPNNITLTLLGAGLLWFGWFGFNAGSALDTSGISVNAFLTTHMAAAAGMLSWMIVEMIRSPKRKASSIGGASGLVAGLVVITPAAGFVTTPSAILMGVAAGVVCCLAIELKHKLGYDDALDVVGVHGVGGLMGAILTGVFATDTVNPSIKATLEAGRSTLIINQLIACGVTIAFAGIGSYILAFVINKITRLRSSESAEQKGLDHSYHGEGGYAIPATEIATSAAVTMVEKEIANMK